MNTHSETIEFIKAHANKHEAAEFFENMCAMAGVDHLFFCQKDDDGYALSLHMAVTDGDGGLWIFNCSGDEITITKGSDYLGDMPADILLRGLSDALVEFSYFYEGIEEMNQNIFDAMEEDKH